MKSILKSIENEFEIFEIILLGLTISKRDFFLPNQIFLLGLTISKRDFFAKPKIGIRVYDFKNTKLGFTILNHEFC